MDIVPIMRNMRGVMPMNEAEKLTYVGTLRDQLAEALEIHPVNVHGKVLDLLESVDSPRHPVFWGMIPTWAFDVIL